jgi:hypothetical protein
MDDWYISLINMGMILTSSAKDKDFKRLVDIHTKALESGHMSRVMNFES